MSLSPEDVQAISALLDDKLGKVQATERRRRRFWIWFWILVFVLSTVASWVVAQRFITEMKAQLAQADDEMRSAKLAYQAELKRSAQLQAERKAAEVASNYTSKQSQSEYEAGLISSLFRMQAQAAALRKMPDANTQAKPGARTEQEAVDELDEAMQDLERTTAVANSAVGLLKQIMLRNTDPAHNSQEDKLVGSEAEGARPSKPIEDGQVVEPTVKTSAQP